MEYKELGIKIRKDVSEYLEVFLDTLPIAGYFETLFDGEDSQRTALGDDTLFHVYLDPNDSQTEIQLLIFLSLVGANCTSKLVDTQEFALAYKEFYKPFLVGRIWLIPEWERDTWIPKEISQEVTLIINPGMAFGTGHHETTKLLLEALSVTKSLPNKACDIGCGSGILSLALLLLGAKDVYAIDIDSNSVRATWENYKLNPITKSKFRAEEASFDAPVLKEETFDLAIANITHAVLTQNLYHLQKIQSPRFLFSGIITEKKDEFLMNLEESIPGKLAYAKELNEWWVLEWIRLS